MFLKRSRHRNERGQVLVIVAMGLVVMVAMVGLVIDGGFAWGQQRKTQNGADAMAEAGAAVLAQNLAGTFPAKTDGDVACAVESAAAANGVSDPVALYTDISGNFLTPAVQVGSCNPGGGAAVPAAAEGVKAGGARTFDTFLARIIGFNQFTASANATAVTGILDEVCPADAGCAILPVTFPLTAIICDDTHQQIQIGTEQWPIVQADDPTAPNYANSSNEVIIPLCTTEDGSVGWLDLGCGNLAETITNPCNADIPIPAWLHTQTGNVNSLGAELNDFAGPVLGTADDSVVLLPINDNTCREQPADDDPTCEPLDDEGSGSGNNLYYHVPKFAGFMVDHVYVQGNDVECKSAPGAPTLPASTHGFAGCFKGWFIRYLLQGPVHSGASGPQDPGVIGLQLIR
jgi:hypothetical protein